jgi:hypothetical protein
VKGGGDDTYLIDFKYNFSAKYSAWADFGRLYYDESAEDVKPVISTSARPRGDRWKWGAGNAYRPWVASAAANASTPLVMAADALLNSTHAPLARLRFRLGLGGRFYFGMDRRHVLLTRRRRAD